MMELEKKSPFGKPHSSNCFRQELFMNDKVSGPKDDETWDTYSLKVALTDYKGKNSTRRKLPPPLHACPWLVTHMREGIQAMCLQIQRGREGVVQW